MLARLMGAACVVAVDVDPAARARACELGADAAFDPGDADVARQIRRHLGGTGLDVALEFVGRPDTVELAIKSLDKTGRAVIVGVGPGRPTLPPLVSFVSREQSVIGAFGMDRADIVDLYALVAAGRLSLDASISARYPLQSANDALQHLASKDRSVVRVLVEPNA
ncbi:MAG: zinc-binding dehydrogenase, partial [Candidatus Binatia bacterium]